MKRVGMLASPEAIKSSRLIAAEYKHKIACEALVTATATARRATADAVIWDTPLTESRIALKGEAEAEKAFKAATLAVRRAKHSVFKAGGVV